MKNKNKYKIIVFIIAMTFSGFSIQKTEASYITSSDQNSTKTVCEDCNWIISYCNGYCDGNFAKYAEGYNYACRSDGSKTQCCESGDIFNHWISCVFESNCDSSITKYWTGSDTPEIPPPDKCHTETTSTTTYTCHYISGVSAWSACQNGVKVATIPVWSTKVASGSSDPNCYDTVALTQSCNNAPSAQIITPATSTSYDYGVNIDFSGSGTDPDGDAITGYNWNDGSCGAGTLLSSNSSFSKNNLESGIHNIYFRVQDSLGAWSTCDSRQIIINPSCIPATAPAGSAFCPGDNQNIGSTNLPATRVDSLADCTDGRKCEYYILPVNGEVGDANNQIYCQRPSENLCEKGVPTDVKESDDGKLWTWTCQGLYGGENIEGRAIKSCAYREVSPN